MISFPCFPTPQRWFIVKRRGQETPNPTELELTKMLLFRQRKQELDATGFAVAHRNIAFVQLNSIFYNSQPQPGASRLTGTAVVNPVKPLENSRQVFVGDSGAGVGIRKIVVFIVLVIWLLWRKIIDHKKI